MRARLRRIRKQIQNFRILAGKYGQWGSVRDWQCVDSEDRPIPWYTYPAIEYLSHLDLTRFSVFEFGSGHSTLWWIERAKSVRSVEDSPEWYEKVRGKMPAEFDGNCCYELHTEKLGYSENLASYHDIVIIDGKHRPECFSRFLEKSGDSVMLIFDNSDWLPQTIERAREALGWVELDFHGFGPINDYTWTTTIFVNPEKHRELRYQRLLQSVSPVANSLERG